MHQRVMLMMFFSWIDKVFNDDIIHTENHQILRNILLQKKYSKIPFKSLQNFVSFHFDEIFLTQS